MANRLLSKDEIVAELIRLDDVDGAKAGYIVEDLKITRLIDGHSVNYSTVDLISPISIFSERILVPLVCHPRKPKEPYTVEHRPEEVRGETHGDYTHMSGVVQDFKTTLHRGEAWDKCSASQREALELIATKIGRIVCGDPQHVDHWDDIIGYATLARDRIARKPAC